MITYKKTSILLATLLIISLFVNYVQFQDAGMDPTNIIAGTFVTGDRLDTGNPDLMVFRENGEYWLYYSPLYLEEKGVYVLEEKNIYLLTPDSNERSPSRVIYSDGTPYNEITLYKYDKETNTVKTYYKIDTDFYRRF